MKKIMIFFLLMIPFVSQAQLKIVSKSEYQTESEKRAKAQTELLKKSSIGTETIVGYEFKTYDVSPLNKETTKALYRRFDVSPDEYLTIAKKILIAAEEQELIKYLVLDYGSGVCYLPIETLQFKILYDDCNKIMVINEKTIWG